MFHDLPAAFLKLLNRDGTRFLFFYWAQAAKQLPPEGRADPFGLNYVMRKPGPRADFSLALVTLPQPASPGEAFYSALAHRPDRRLLLVSDTTAVFNLEMGESEGEAPPTVLVQWTRKGEREVARRGVNMALEEFYNAVLNELLE